MKFRIVARFLAVIVFLISLCMLMPLGWAVKDGSRDIRAFAVSIAAGCLFSLTLFLFGYKARAKDMGTREAFAAVALAWIFASLQGCLPYIAGGYIPSFTDAYFEAMSGFTTTGATVLTNIEMNPRGILMWRAQTQWLGGMGIVVLTLALLPMLGMSVTQLFKAEVPGPVLEKISPRIQDAATMLWKVYMGLTVLGIIVLVSGGMSFYESICHIFTAVSTGGFSPRNASIAAYNSAYFDWALTIIMFLSGANFNLHLLAIKNRTLSPYKDPEFSFYVKTVFAASLAISFYLYTQGFSQTVMHALRYGAFQVVSIMTTTGYVTADYSLWPPFTQVLLLSLMFVGGCAGSTAGSIKCIRIQVVFRQIAAEVKRFIHPHAAITVRVGNQTIESRMVASSATFIVLYVLIFVFSSIAVSATGEDLITSFSAVATTLGNVGPGFGAVGPVNNFASQNDAAKWIYSFCMLCGRLELYTILVLFSRDTWHR
ncbi:MAG: TrkH family potassium uptake protein [Synergistota bacterium]|nr:TrkH family potassium uptake protein [Synergistota bacterium]